MEQKVRVPQGFAQNVHCGCQVFGVVKFEQVKYHGIAMIRNSGRRKRPTKRHEKKLFIHFHNNGIREMMCMVNFEIYKNVTYKQIEDMKRAINFDLRNITGDMLRTLKIKRNFYFASDMDCKDWDRLVAIGLAENIAGNDSNCYGVSGDGIMFLEKVLGLSIEEEGQEKDDTSEDEHLNIFQIPMTESEQIELSDALDNFSQAYENEFFDLILEGEREETSNALCYEFKELYELINKLSDRAITGDYYPEKRKYRHE